MKNKIIFIIVLVSLTLIFVVDLSKAFNYFGDVYKSNKLKNNLIDDVVLIQKNDNEQKISINFNKLLQMNKDTVGWINYNNDKINYPIVKSSDNDYYLNHAFNGSYNQSGSIFMDYRNNPFIDRNTVIYGHSMLDGSMFGSIRDVFKKDYFNKNENNYIKIYTKDNKVITYQVFSYYIIEVEDYYIKTSFTDEEYQEFINVIVNRSEKDFNIPISINDKILTLSTCYGTGDTKMRKVIHAKMVVDSDI